MGATISFLLEGDMQGNEMDGHASFRLGNVQLSFDVIAADGKAYVRPVQGEVGEVTREAAARREWARSATCARPSWSSWAGPRPIADLYTVNWDQATHAARALQGTLFSSLKVKSAVMQFQVDANGKPYTATYQLKGTGKADGKSFPLDLTGYYQFFAVREPLEFESPHEVIAA